MDDRIDLDESGSPIRRGADRLDQYIIARSGKMPDRTTHDPAFAPKGWRKMPANETCCAGYKYSEFSFFHAIWIVADYATVLRSI
jgi:hypothetical protein